VFVKHALTEDAAGWLRTERLVLESVQAPFTPAYHGAYDKGSCTLIVIEDLSAASWPPPWSSDRIDAVLAALEALHATRPPEGLPTLDGALERVIGWPAVAADREPLLSTGLCSRSWLDEALPHLRAAATNADLSGTDLLHLDVRSDNLCFSGDRVVLVDWNLACVGNGRFDIAFWLPSLRLEGGPHPSEVLPNAGGLAAAVAGFFAARAGLPPPAGAPTVRTFQRAQAEVALHWAAGELGLRLPS
jgi:aminoglycoside phosphotransferase (APT) family kinase protein